jgi:hypothetical protein
MFLDKIRHENLPFPITYGLLDSKESAQIDALTCKINP